MAEQEPEVIDGVDEASNKRGDSYDQEIDLYTILHRVIVTILCPDQGSSAESTPLLQRIKIALSENWPLLKEGFTNSGKKLLQWTRRGSPLRAPFVISVGTIALLSLTGVVVFMLFFLAATFNAVAISLLMSLAAAGGFLALFFACLTAIYIGALSVAILVISTATISATVAVLVVTGWIGFFWTVWLVTKKSVGVAKHSLTVTGSAISAYSSSRHYQRHLKNKKKLKTND